MTKEDNEIWKDVVGYEGYQVSSLGRVKSINIRNGVKILGNYILINPK